MGHVVRAAVYCRLSRSKDAEELGANIRDQQETGKALVEKRGWTLVEGPTLGTFTDDGHGAYQDNAKRPAWDALLAAKPDVVVVRDVSRLGRRIEDWIDLKNTVDRAVVWIDRFKVNWEAAAEKVDDHAFLLKMASSRQYSEDNGAKIANKFRLHAAAGGWKHGGTRPFGYHSGNPAKCCGQDDCTPAEVRRDEAEVILDCAHRWLGGESMLSLCRDLEDRGITTTAGKPWQHGPLRTMLCGPRIAGIRTHNGKEHKGQWEAIVDADLHARLVQAEGGRQKRINRFTYTLSGLMYCGRCGSKMYGQRASTHWKTGEVRPRYTCLGCFNGIVCDRTDEWVSARSTLAIVGPALQTDVTAAAELVSLSNQIDDIDERLKELDSAYWSDRTITKDRWLTVSSDLQVKAQDARELITELKRRTAINADAPRSAQEYAERWQAADPAERNRMLRVGVDRVVIHPIVPGKSKFNPGRIEVIFRNGRSDRVDTSDWVSDGRQLVPPPDHGADPC